MRGSALRETPAPGYAADRRELSGLPPHLSPASARAEIPHIVKTPPEVRRMDAPLLANARIFDDTRLYENFECIEISQVCWSGKGVERGFRRPVKLRVKPIVVSRQTTAGCFIRREARKFFLECDRRELNARWRRACVLPLSHKGRRKEKRSASCPVMTSGHVVLAVQKPVRCPTGKSLKSCPALSRKIFRCACRANHLYKLAPSRLIMRGGSRSSRNAGRDAVDACGALGRGARAGGRRSRVVLTPRRWRQVGGSNSAGDGGKQARSPGRARRKPLKPLRRECRVMPVCTCGDYARVLFHFAREAAGALRARHSLRPLNSSGQDVKAKLACDARRDRGGLSARKEMRLVYLSPQAGRGKKSSIQHPLAVGAVERKGRHVDVEMFAAFAHHLVAAGHEARRGRKRHAAGVFEAFARREHGLFADHALAANFLLAARGVGDDPVPRPQLHRLRAGVGDDDGIGPEILTALDRGALRQEVRLDGDFNLAGDGAVHANGLSKCRDIIPKSRGGTNRRRNTRRVGLASSAVPPNLHAIRRPILCSSRAGRSERACQDGTK